MLRNTYTAVKTCWAVFVTFHKPYKSFSMQVYSKNRYIYSKRKWNIHEYESEFNIGECRILLI